MKRGPTNESVQVAVVGSIWGVGDKTDGTVIGRVWFGYCQVWFTSNLLSRVLEAIL